MITFGAKVIDGVITIEDKNEIAEIKWMDIDTANNLMPYHPGGIKSLLKSPSPYTFQDECWGSAEIRVKTGHRITFISKSNNVKNSIKETRIVKFNLKKSNSLVE